MAIARKKSAAAIADSTKHLCFASAITSDRGPTLLFSVPDLLDHRKQEYGNDPWFADANVNKMLRHRAEMQVSPIGMALL